MCTVQFSYITIKVDKFLGKGNHGKVYKTTSGYAVKIMNLTSKEYNYYIEHYNSIRDKISNGYLSKSLCKIHKIEYTRRLLLQLNDGTKYKYKNCAITWMEICDKPIHSIIKHLHNSNYDDVSHQYYMIARQLILAVKECQEKKLILGDLSINNVMINGYPEKTTVKIIDYIHMNNNYTTTHSPPEYMIAHNELEIRFDPELFDNYNYNYDFIGLANVLTTIFVNKQMYTYFLSDFFKGTFNLNTLSNTIFLNAAFIYAIGNTNNSTLTKFGTNTIDFSCFDKENPIEAFLTNCICDFTENRIIKYIVNKQNIISQHGFKHYIYRYIVSKKSLNVDAFFGFICKMLKFDYKERELDFDMFDEIFIF